MHGSPIMFDTDLTEGYMIKRGQSDPRREPGAGQTDLRSHPVFLATHEPACHDAGVTAPASSAPAAAGQRDRHREGAASCAGTNTRGPRGRRRRHRLHPPLGRVGHWRNQPYGTKEDRYYKQIWIAPYVKGPEDKPLVVKKRGVELTRRLT